MNNHRVWGFDIARAIAFFGMVIVNFKVAMGADRNGPDWLVACARLLDGRAAATFVVLAGVGVSLLSNAARIEGDSLRLRSLQKLLLKRAFFLFVVGLLFITIWPADILHFYGAYIAIAALLITLSSRWLLAIAGGSVLLFVVLFFTLDYERDWNWDTLQYSGVWTFAGMFRHLLFNGFHPVLPWFSFLLFGMVLGRSDLTDLPTRRRWLVFGISVTVFAEALSWFLIKLLSKDANSSNLEAIVADFGTAPMPPMPLYILTGIGVACVVISLSVAIGQKLASSCWLKPLVETGQLALTLYVAQVILGMGTLEATDRLENQSLIFSLKCAVMFCIFATVFAQLWLARFQRGPLESIMRRLTG